MKGAEAMKTCYIVGAGDFTSRGLAPAEGDLLIAADGGYDWLRQSGLTPDFLLGDLDSLGVLPSLPAKTKLLRYPVHLNHAQFERLKAANAFAETVPYHSPELSAAREILF